MQHMTHPLASLTKNCPSSFAGTYRWRPHVERRGDAPCLRLVSTFSCLCRLGAGPGSGMWMLHHVAWLMEVIDGQWLVMIIYYGDYGWWWLMVSDDLGMIMWWLWWLINVNHAFWWLSNVQIILKNGLRFRRVSLGHVRCRIANAQ